MTYIFNASFAILKKYSISNVGQRHHKEDVIVGASLGAVTATLCYLIYWPSPLADPVPATPRAQIVYGNSQSSRRRCDYSYELAGVEGAHETEPV